MTRTFTFVMLSLGAALPLALAEFPAIIFLTAPMFILGVGIGLFAHWLFDKGSD